MEILRGYSILGSALQNGYFIQPPVQSALVVVKTFPKSRVFLGCGIGRSEDEIYDTVAKLGDEISFEFIEKLYLMMKKERSVDDHTR